MLRISVDNCFLVYFYASIPVLSCLSSMLIYNCECITSNVDIQVIFKAGVTCRFPFFGVLLFGPGRVFFFLFCLFFPPGTTQC
jgi:hypothetical protein